MKLKSIFIIGALALLSSCGAGGAKFSGLEKPTQGMAQVYIYRPSSMAQFHMYPNVSIDGKSIGELKNGGFLKSNLPEGGHIISITKNGLWRYKNRYLKVKLEAGETYFYVMTVNNTNAGNYIIVNVGFGPVADKKQALADLSELNESK